MTAPRLLDLFCCEGGAAIGYHRAGFDVVGVDIEGKYAKRYPFEFHCADAIEFVREHGREFDAIHASPPCQAYSVATAGTPGAREKHPQLVEQTRLALQDSGKPYVIENVVGAPLVAPLLLCGSMFDLTALDDDGTPLRMERHRLFEVNFPVLSPGECWHRKEVRVGGSYGGGRTDRWEAKHVRRGGYTPAKHVRADLLGIEREHMTLYGLSQAIPPTYTEWIGWQLMDALALTGATP